MRLTKCLCNDRKSADEAEQLERLLCLLEMMSGSGWQQQIRLEMEVVAAEVEVQGMGFV